MKKLVFGLAAVMMCVSLAGCGGKAVDINELASALSSDGKFAEQLTEVSSDIAEKRYMISDGEVEECVSYTGTPAVVDEITIFKTSDTESVKEKAEQHIETQKQHTQAMHRMKCQSLTTALLKLSAITLSYA